MNNNELFHWFNEIFKGNIFDASTALKNKAYIKKYKTSDYYKQTHHSFKKAYYLYTINSFSTITKILNNDLFIALSKNDYGWFMSQLEDIIKEFDVSSLEGLFDYITEKLLSIDLSENKNNLESAIKELKQSLNL